MVNINPAYRAHELQYVLRQSGIALLVASLAHKGSDYRALVDQVRGSCPDPLTLEELRASAAWPITRSPAGSSSWTPSR